MTEIQHGHIERDLAAVKAAEAKVQAAAEKKLHAEHVHADAKRAYDSAVSRFHATVEATKKFTISYGGGSLFETIANFSK